MGGARPRWSSGFEIAKAFCFVYPIARENSTSKLLYTRGRMSPCLPEQREIGAPSWGMVAKLVGRNSIPVRGEDTKE